MHERLVWWIQKIIERNMEHPFFLYLLTNAPHGHYRLSLRQCPKEAGENLETVRAKKQIAGQAHEAMVSNRSDRIVFDLQLPEGKTKCITWSYDEQGKACVAYFMEAELL